MWSKMTECGMETRIAACAIFTTPLSTQNLPFGSVAELQGVGQETHATAVPPPQRRRPVVGDPGGRRYKAIARLGLWCLRELRSDGATGRARTRPVHLRLRAFSDQ